MSCGPFVQFRDMGSRPRPLSATFLCLDDPLELSQGDGRQRCHAPVVTARRYGAGESSARTSYIMGWVSPRFSSPAKSVAITCCHAPAR